MPELMLSAQASGAEIKPSLLSINNHYSTMDIRQPLPFSMSLRMANLITELGCLSTKITLCHNSNPLQNLRYFENKRFSKV